jgi:hypothetical protein
MRADDIGIVTNQKAQVKIRRVLEKAPLPINLVFVNHPHAYSDPENIGDPDRSLVGGHMQNFKRASGTMSEEQFYATYGVALKNEPGSLTAVFAFNEGTDRMPLTPWLIAHRLCHLVEEAYGSGKGGMAPIMVDLQNRWSQLGYDAVGTTSIQEFLCDIGTTKTCRDGTLVNIGEFVAECFAQYLITGRIKLNPVQKIMNARVLSDTRRLYPKLADMIEAKPETTIPDPDAVNVGLEKWRQAAEVTFMKELEGMKGRIVVM